MDRIAYLVAKLQDLLEQKANPETMLVVTQMLEDELMQIRSAEKQAEKKKVAVRMPVNGARGENGYHSNGHQQKVDIPSLHTGQGAEPDPADEDRKEEIPVMKAAVAIEPTTVALEVPVNKNGSGHEQETEPGPSSSQLFVKKETTVIADTVEEASVIEDGRGRQLNFAAVDGKWLEHAEYNGSKLAAAPASRFDVLEEVPTLSHQVTAVKELNELMSEETPSLNDRLKENKTELAEKLQGAPIRDLRKAINVNDRYRFIMELFRGDEAMFERSLKTINHFSIFAEAQYWIQRELKLKLGWRDDQPAVLLFDQLVKRRFS